VYIDRNIVGWLVGWLVGQICLWIDSWLVSKTGEGMVVYMVG